MQRGAAASAGDGGGERNLLGTDRHAVLGVTAHLNAAGAGEGVEALTTKK